MPARPLLVPLVAVALLGGCAKGLELADSDGTGTGGTGQGGASNVTITVTGTASTTGPGGTTSSNTSSVTSGNTSSTTSGGGACDGTGDCATCASCSNMGMCLASYNACVGSIDCLDYDYCISLCASGDTLCYDDCSFYYPIGEQEWLTWATCVVCTDCYVDCDGASACI